MSRERVSSDDVASAADSRSKKASRSPLSQSVDFMKGRVTSKSSIFAFGSSKPSQATGGIGKSSKKEILPELTPPPPSPSVPYPAHVVIRQASNDLHDSSKIIELEAQKSSLESQLNRVKDQLCSAEANYISLEHGYESLKIELSCCKEELRTCKDKMENAQLTSDIFTRALSETVVQQDALFKGVQFPLEAAAAQLEAAELRLQEQEEELGALRRTRDETKARTEGMDQLRDENEWLQETIGKLQRQTASLESQLRQKTEEVDSMMKVAEALKDAGTKLRLSEAESKRRADAEIEKLRVAVAVADENAKERQGEVRELQLALDAATHELNAAKENLEGLAQAEANAASFEREMALQQDFLQSAISARQAAMQQVEAEKLARLEVERDSACHEQALREAEEKISRLERQLAESQEEKVTQSSLALSPSVPSSLTTPRPSIVPPDLTRGQYTASLLSPYRLPLADPSIAFGPHSSDSTVDSSEALVSLLEDQIAHRESQLAHKEGQIASLRGQLEAAVLDGEEKGKEIGLLMERVKVNVSLRAKMEELEGMVVKAKEEAASGPISALPAPAPASQARRRFRPLRFLLGLSLKTLALGTFVSAGVALSRTPQGKMMVDQMEEKVKVGAAWSVDQAVRAGGSVARASKAAGQGIRGGLSKMKRRKQEAVAVTRVEKA